MQNFLRNSPSLWGKYGIRPSKNIQFDRETNGLLFYKNIKSVTIPVKNIYQKTHIKDDLKTAG